jgi:hypothetical protein
MTEDEINKEMNKHRDMYLQYGLIHASGLDTL